jgi:hypothetical protein
MEDGEMEIRKELIKCEEEIRMNNKWRINEMKIGKLECLNK